MVPTQGFYYYAIISNATSPVWVIPQFPDVHNMQASLPLEHFLMSFSRQSLILGTLLFTISSWVWSADSSVILSERSAQQDTETYANSTGLARIKQKIVSQNLTLDQLTTIVKLAQDPHLPWAQTDFSTSDYGTEYIRRIPWRFLSQGCEIRAELLNDLIAQRGYARLQKVFAFVPDGSKIMLAVNANVGVGNLQTKPYWSHHVALITKVGATEYVVDPALNNSAPLTLDQWIKAIQQPPDVASGYLQASDATIDLSVCSSSTIKLDSKCNSALVTADDRSFMARETANSMRLEWMTGRSLSTYDAHQAEYISTLTDGLNRVCSTSISSTSARVSESITFNVTPPRGLAFPVNASTYFYGKKQEVNPSSDPFVKDEKGSYLGPIAGGVFTIKNDGAFLPIGVYKRSFLVRDNSGVAFCATKELNFTLSADPVPPTCSLSIDKSAVLVGDSMTFTVQGTSLPNGANYFWYGTHNGVQDATNQPGGSIPPGKQVAANGGGSMTGLYTRQAVIRTSSDPNSAAVCTTNTVSVNFLTPTCTLQVDKTTVARGGTVTFTVGGSNLPSTANYFWYGSHNGVQDANNDLGGPIPPGIQQVLNGGGGMVGSYTRSAVIRLNSSPSSQALCTTLPVTVNLQ